MIWLTDEQWERIRKHFPEEHIPDGRAGRKPIPTRHVLEAVLWILNTGAQWHMLPQSYPNYKTVHRRFQTWCCNEILRLVLTDVANELRENGALDEEECFIDATFVMAKGGGSEIGPTKRGKGMKIMAIVDRHGLPLSVSTHAANHHEVRLVQLCFDFYMIEAKPENLIGDRAYDSDPLDEELRNDGIEMIAPHRSNRSKPPTQDRRRLSRYKRRWLVERFFAWIQWQRRILVRWEYHAQNFLGFVQLACLVVLFCLSYRGEFASGGRADINRRKSGHQIGQRGICFVNSGFAEIGADTLSFVGGFKGRGGPVENISEKPMVLGGRPFRLRFIPPRRGRKRGRAGAVPDSESRRRNSHNDRLPNRPREVIAQSLIDRN